MSNELSDRISSSSHLTAARFTRELALLLPASSRSPTPAVPLGIFGSPRRRASPSQQGWLSGPCFFARRTAHCTEIIPAAGITTNWTPVGVCSNQKERQGKKSALFPIQTRITGCRQPSSLYPRDKQAGGVLSKIG